MAASLPHLPDFERLSSSVIRVLGGNPSKFTLQGTNTYLVGPSSSRNRILIDTGQGFPAWISSLSAILQAENATVSTCLITHWHHDHVLGIKDLRKLCPDVKIFKFLPTYWVSPEYPSFKPDGVDEADGGVAEIVDGMIFEGDGGLRLRTVHCPGHTDDHCAFVLENGVAEQGDQGAMFTGDNVLGHGTSVFSSLSTYVNSLHRMSSELPASPSFPPRAYPGHGIVLLDAKAKIQEYIRHRQEREDEIIRALASLSRSLPSAPADGVTAMQIVKVVYKDTPENLHEAAERGVKMVLEKLEGEGKVERVKRAVGEGEDGWRLVNGEKGRGNGKSGGRVAAL